MNKICDTIKNRQKPNDIIYTPNQVVDYHLSLVDINENNTYLDPCFGGGAYYNKLPNNKEWTEIEKGKDFFKVKKKYDWCIGNPPYSILDKWLKHTFKICSNFSYLIGIMNLTPRRMEMIEKEGFHINKISILKIPTWFQRSVIVVCNKVKQQQMILYKNMGNKCMFCGCPCGGMRGKNIKHCKRKASDKICKY